MSDDPWDAPRDNTPLGGDSHRITSSGKPEQPGQPGQPGPGGPGPGPGQPLQFGISGLLALTTVVAVVFGVLRWLGISTQAAWVVLLLMVVGGIGAVALVWAIAQSAGRHDGDD